ncbi:TPA_asm: RNA-directed RNA polymerase [ssRNA phage Gephyllon.2_13]|uniref:RNA-directed RNA polymerase n=2 Tax=Norzivirales TaxID=2842247 RepID=A0A8S5KY17_9VIRU|nr:RNA-directed RNA polymerase [ssRNA phage Gephyllon.2_13]QDH90318.1 MAG: RNA-dependent RNA polymerase [Leviviridae sp.]DAD50068.1 TPA_asm: RNA-directed RNA polymerase [ssRNA phage Gephyllon.2_13]
MRDYARLYRSLLDDLSFCKTLDQPFFTADQSLRDVWATNLAQSLFKKLAPKGQSKKALSASLVKFLNVNGSIAQTWVPPVGNDNRLLAVEYWKQNFAETLDFEIAGTNFDLDFIRDNFRPGPGASIDANADNFYTKMFDSPLSGTHPYLVALYRAAIVKSPTWATAERIRADSFGFTTAKGNKLFFVPKSSDISRTCCTEPALNMLFQQALGRFLEHRLKKTYRIDLSSQPDVNRKLARIGSNDGSFATIDLASASDSISWSLMQQSIPANLLGYFRLFRSPETVLPDGSPVQLSMISTMGNGFTFPLQTIIFASAVKACYQLKGIHLYTEDNEPNFSVFGDDIIVRREAYESVITLLGDLGFKVNDGKSFNVGPFRESCGFDYFKGIPVRGVFITSLETQSDVYSAFNRLARWSAVTSIPIDKTLRLLLSWARFLPIPIERGDDEGFKVSSAQAPLKTDGNGWVKYRYLAVPSTTRRVPRDCDEANNFKLKGFNPYGWAVSYLGGYTHNPERVIKPLAKGDEKSLAELPSDWGGFLEKLPPLSQAWDLIGYRPAQGVTLHRRLRSSNIPFWDYYDDKDPRFPARFLDGWKSVLARVM